MSMKKKIALFTCLINFIPMVNINFANAMDKSKIATNISGDELGVLNEFKQGNWKVIKEYETGSYSSNVYRVKRDNDTVDYILKVLKQGDEQSFGCEKLACDKFKSYLQGKDDKTILENICPPLDYKSINKNYYVIYEAAVKY